ncbi:MAG: hypothetical protein CL920_38220 [Deltaproteobacteria bacterium]|nr:hypothetical protein [Deltaproteobacteria bacterium]MBU49774.1 hypothetical protein [Deltaproteobacteria bacterium]MBU54570.1 hypothetical protein [Deltaproteobacteria bacterium]
MMYLVVCKRNGGSWGRYEETCKKFKDVLPAFVLLRSDSTVGDSRPKWSSREKDIQHRGRTQGPTLRGKCNIMLIRLLRQRTT